jgi:two-component system, OmpR family, KDP operon response regulator KdpE
MTLQFDRQFTEEEALDDRGRPLVLVVDDEMSIRELLVDCLCDDFEAIQASDGSEALSMVDRVSPDLVILDIMMPGLSGFQVLQQIRQTLDTPVIMLSARTDVTDKVEAFKLGADDYMTKPFVIGELMARIKAVLRRNPGKNSPDRIDSDDGYLRIELTKRRVWVKGREVELTPKEFSLLQVLFLGAGAVRDYRSLLKTIWGPEYRDEKESVQAVVKRLRSKIEPDPRNPQYILTVDNIGYRFKDI